jgi:putative ABC transport system ATP-binding protein
VVMVTHDPHAASIADRVLFLEDGKLVSELVGAGSDDIIAAMKKLGSH